MHTDARFASDDTLPPLSARVARLHIVWQYDAVTWHWRQGCRCCCVAVPPATLPCRGAPRLALGWLLPRGCTSASCPSWAIEGECETNAGYMRKRCPASCGVCQTLESPKPSKRPIDAIDYANDEEEEHGKDEM